MKVKVYSRGETEFHLDGEYQEPAIREAIEDGCNDVASQIIDYTDSERSNISHDSYAVVTEGDGTELWRGWLDGGDAPAPDSPNLTYTPVGYQGAAAHTFTTGCDGFHPVAEQCNLPAEDAPGTEPQPAKVIIVTEMPTGDRAPVERRYTASQWDDSDYSRLRLIRSGHPVGSYQAGAWLSVREDGAEVPDATARALGIARRALEAVTRISDGNVAIKLAADALEEIFAETEL